MLNSSTTGSRTAGKMIILAAVAVALPLTATRAIDYVDVPAAPHAPVVPSAPLAPQPSVVAAALSVQPVAPVAPLAPVPPLPPAPRQGDLNINNDMVTINGQTKRWDQLTPAERQMVRREIAEAREELARTRIDRAEIERDVREALADVKIDREELRRDLAEARIEIDQAMREIDSNADNIRRSGQDPERIKAQVRASLRAVEAIDVEAITRQAMASVNPAAIAASLAAAEASIARAHAEMDRLEGKLEQFERDDD